MVCADKHAKTCRNHAVISPAAEVTEASCRDEICIGLMQAGVSLGALEPGQQPAVRVRLCVDELVAKEHFLVRFGGRLQLQADARRKGLSSGDFQASLRAACRALRELEDGLSGGGLVIIEVPAQSLLLHSAQARKMSARENFFVDHFRGRKLLRNSKSLHGSLMVFIFGGLSGL